MDARDKRTATEIGRYWCVIVRGGWGGREGEGGNHPSLYLQGLRHQAPVVQTLDSAIHRINHYPADKYYGNQLRYPLDSDLFGG